MALKIGDHFTTQTRLTIQADKSWPETQESTNLGADLFYVNRTASLLFPVWTLGYIAMLMKVHVYALDEICICSSQDDPHMGGRTWQDWNAAINLNYKPLEASNENHCILSLLPSFLWIFLFELIACPYSLLGKWQKQSLWYNELANKDFMILFHVTNLLFLCIGMQLYCYTTLCTCAHRCNP